MPKNWFFGFIIFSFSALCASSAHADRAEQIKAKPPTTALDRLSIFSKSFDAKAVVEIQDVTEKETPKKEQAKQEESEPQKNSKRDLRYTTDNPNDDQVLPPNETPSVRVNPDAPSSIRAMISAKREGDKDLALSYASQFVRYQQNFFFEVRDIVDLIGQAMVKEQVINDDEWVGVGQMIDFELAKTRYTQGSILKPTHEAAMKRVEADPKQQVEIYYFFSLSCSWCRYMAPDVERLWRIAKQDSRVKMTALTIGGNSKDWLEEYKSYSDWSLPVVEGDDLAKHWNIGFVPALVIVTPNGNKAFMKTGQESFERMYEFMRTAQGLPATITEDFITAAATPIGQVERMKAGKTVVTKVSSAATLSSTKQNKEVEIQRF